MHIRLLLLLWEKLEVIYENVFNKQSLKMTLRIHYNIIIDSIPNKYPFLIGLGLWCFNTTFNNISVISVEKTTDLSQVTDKLYHIIALSTSHLSEI